MQENYYILIIYSKQTENKKKIEYTKITTKTQKEIEIKIEKNRKKIKTKTKFCTILTVSWSVFKFCVHSETA